MKQKRLSSLRQNILNKKSALNKEKKEKIILTNIYPYYIPVKFHDITNKDDELLMKKKIFNYSKNLNYLSLGSSNINSFKSIKKNNSNLKNTYNINNMKEKSLNKSQKNYLISHSIDKTNSNNNSKDLINKKENNYQINNLIYNNIFNNKNKKQKNNLSVSKIKINKGNTTFFSDSGGKIKKIDKNISDFSISKIQKKKENSLSSINNNKSSEKKKNILFKKNLHNIDLLSNGKAIFKNMMNGNQDYRKFLFNEKISNIDKKNKVQLDENKNEMMEIIKDNKIKNKGLIQLYNQQNNIANQNKKNKNSIKYPSFNSPKHIAINNSNLYNMSKGDISYKKPLMILSPSSNNSITKNKKDDKMREYNLLLEKNEMNLFNLLSDKIGKKNENDNNSTNKINNSSNPKSKKNVDHLQIFSQSDINKNWNSNNVTNINIDQINNLTKNLENVKKKLKLKKPITNNKTEFLLKKEKEVENFNRIIEKYTNLPKNNKEITKKVNDEKENNIKNKKNDFISKKLIGADKKEEEFGNISEISKGSTAVRDSNYYMQKSKNLIEYIKGYYEKYNKYPETKINFYLYGRRIGQGAFGKVNLGLNVLTGRVVAIKSFKKTSETKFYSNMKKILYETNLMKRFNHPNITKILEVFHDEDYMLIIMEYINGGNLFSFVKKRRKLSEKTAKFLFKQIILGIRHIHSQNIAHRDIKLENIIIDLNNNVKICDFGIGKVLNSPDEILYDKCGTPMYMAPEIILCNKKRGYKGFPVDIWSSGITLYIMLSGALPFNIKNRSTVDEFSLSDMRDKNENSDLKYQIVNNKPKKIKNISNEAKNLLNRLLDKNPEKRPTCDEILNHPWLKNNNIEVDNNKYHLFTKAEMTMMSKTYIDYRKGELEDLRENFTITNLKSDEIKLCEKNITTKSSILAPFNSAMNNNNSVSSSFCYSMDKFDDFNNSKIKLENDLIIFNNKVKEFNLNYEINNNQEVDNGMLINTKSEASSSISGKNYSVISHNDNKKNIEKASKNSDDMIEYQVKESKKDNNYFNEKTNIIDVNNPKVIKILNEIESFGYQKEYVINCIKNNALCHASTVFYLLKNYGDIE